MDSLKNVLPSLPENNREGRAEEFQAEALPHLNDLFRTATRLLGNPADAEDMVQETYLLAWKSFNRFEAGTDCRAWLFTIMFNAIRHYRRKWFDRRMTGQTDGIMDDSPGSSEPVSEELADPDILAAVDSIPPEFRAVVLLADVQEFSYKDVSQIMKVPMGTVMSRLCRGRRLLRASLAELARSYGIRSPSK